MKIDIDKYIEVGFDTLQFFNHLNGWIAGFFCQGMESKLNDGLICYLPLQGKSEKIREKHLSPYCSTPQEAIDKAYKLWRINEKNRN